MEPTPEGADMSAESASGSTPDIEDVVIDRILDDVVMPLIRP